MAQAMKINTRSIRSASEGSAASASLTRLASGTSSLLQRKPLIVNTPRDRYEQEADRVADAVIRIGVVDRQRRLAIGRHKTVPAYGGIAYGTSLLNHGVEECGQPLKTSTREFFETRLGYDFSQIRIHSDQVAADSARELGALAYTSRNHIVFSAGQYDPGSLTGLRLLAHEFTHVIQQVEGPNSCNRVIQRQESQIAAPPSPTAAPTENLTHYPSLAMPDWRENFSPILASASGSTSLEGFAMGSVEIPLNAEPELRRTARNILYFLDHRYSRSTVEVTGHADTVDTPERNFKLGLDRADAVRSFLQNDGIPAAKIEITSKGDTDLAVETKDERPEPRNRRAVVNFKVVESTPSILLDHKDKPSSKVLPPSPLLPTNPLPRIVPPLWPSLPRSDPKDLWRKMQENQRKIEDYDRKHSRNDSSLTDLAIEEIMKIVKPVVRKILPKTLQSMAEEKIRDAIKTGSQKVCEAVIDGIEGIDGSAKEALKASCKAALKQNLLPGTYP